MKVVLAGPPQSGKSCLRDRLSRAISRNCPSGKDYLSYVITACPDGEGSWFAETHHGDPDFADKLKSLGKSTFTENNTELFADWVHNCSLPLTLIDIGGKISDQNRRICAGATHAVLVYSDESKLAEWRDFCDQLGLPIIAEIHSDLQQRRDVSLAIDEDGVYKGTIHNLKRGELQIGPVETALAKLLLDMSDADSESHSRGTDDDDIFRMQLDGNLLVIGFGKKSAQNTELVPQVCRMIDRLIADNGIESLPLIRVYGRTSVPIAYLLALKLDRVCESIAVFDPKQKGYVIVKCGTNSDFSLGQLIQ